MDERWARGTPESDHEPITAGAVGPRASRATAPLGRRAAIGMRTCPLLVDRTARSRSSCRIQASEMVDDDSACLMIRCPPVFTGQAEERCNLVPPLEDFFVVTFQGHLVASHFVDRKAMSKCPDYSPPETQVSAEAPTLPLGCRAGASRVRRLVCRAWLRTASFAALLNSLR